MKKAKIDYSLYLLTDHTCLGNRSLIDCLKEALAGGVTLVQYRNKNTDCGIMYDEAKKVKAICDAYNIPLIINDRLDLAIALNAAGVHLGQRDLPCKIARKILGDKYVIGVSAHNVQEAQKAVVDGADYLGCGAVFGTNSKSDVGRLGLTNLENIKKAVSIPVVGIGGINCTNYAQVLNTNADGVAVISGILGVDNIYKEVQNFIEIKNSLKQ